MTGRESLPAARKRAWEVRRDHGGGWHHVVDLSGIIVADVSGGKRALAVARLLGESRGEPVKEQTEDDVCDPMFTKAAMWRCDCPLNVCNELPGCPTYARGSKTLNPARTTLPSPITSTKRRAL